MEKRTLLEWAELLPPSIKKDVVRALEARSKSPVVKFNLKFSKETFLPNAFVWEDVTPTVGTELSNCKYWQDISNKIKRGEIKLREPLENILEEINKEIYKDGREENGW